MSNTQLKFIDLFCGCGGFTLGLIKAGFRCIAVIDNDLKAIETIKKNIVDVDFAIQKDLTRFPPEKLSEIIKLSKIDIIVGGPPCQGFSVARKVDGTNNGVRLKEDSRRELYKVLLEYVNYFQPYIFVMENVTGIRTADNGKYIAKVQNEARSLGLEKGLLGYRVHSQIENAWSLGVPQKRRRQLIVGVRGDLPGFFPVKLIKSANVPDEPLLGDVLFGLPKLEAGEGDDEIIYPPKKRFKYPSVRVKNYLENIIEINKSDKLTNHVARPHSARDLRDFTRLEEGESSAIAIRTRGIEFEFPYKKSHFKDRYTRQSRFKLCSTIVAHLSKDGLMFIHPTENRSLTPREVARIQSFPDWFRFPPERTHAFRLIGNAVPPLVAEAVGGVHE